MLDVEAFNYCFSHILFDCPHLQLNHPLPVFLPRLTRLIVRGDK